METFLVTGQTAPKLELPVASLSAEPGTMLEQQMMSFDGPKIMDGVASHEAFQTPVQEPGSGWNDNSPKHEQDKKKEKGALVKRKMRRSHIPNAPSKENKQETTPMNFKVWFFRLIVSTHSWMLFPKNLI